MSFTATLDVFQQSGEFHQSSSCTEKQVSLECYLLSVYSVNVSAPNNVFSLKKWKKHFLTSLVCIFSG